MRSYFPQPPALRYLPSHPSLNRTIPSVPQSSWHAPETEGEREYCYTVWSCPSVRLSVRPSVTLCMHCGSRGVVYRAKKLYQRVPSRQVPICSFRHFCCRMYRLATKRTEKNESKKTRTWVFWDTDSDSDSVDRPLLLFTEMHELWSTSAATFEWTEFGCVHKLCSVEPDCVPTDRKLVLKPIW